MRRPRATGVRTTGGGGANPPKWRLDPASGLWVPTHFRLEERKSAMSFFAVRLGYKDVFGKEATWDDLRDRLQRYQRTTILNLLFRISLVIDRSRSTEGGETQELLIPEIFGPVGERVWTRFQAERSRDEGPVALFDPTQLLTIAKAAFLIDGPPPGDDLATSPTALGEALLMASDLISKEDERLTQLDPRSEEGRQAWQLWMLANVTANRRENMVHAMARNYDLYLSDKDHLRNDDAYVFLPGLVEKVTGLAVDVLWMALSAAGALSLGLKDQDVFEADIRIRRSTYFAGGYEFSPEEVDRFFDLVAADEASVAAEVRKLYAPEKLQPFNPLPFARWPIVFFGDIGIPVSSRLLYEKLMAGLHHLFLNQQALTRKERERYLRFMGTVFQDYVHRLLIRVYGHGTERYIPGESLRAVAPGKVCDGILCYPDSLILIECKAGLFPLGVRTAQDPTTYRRLVNDLLLHAAAQIDETIRATRKGAFESLGLESDSVKRFYPLIVTLENAPTNPLLRDDVLEEMRKRGTLADHDVAPFEVMDVGELEAVETAITQGDSFLRLIADKVSSQEAGALSFTNWWFARDKKLVQGDHNRYLSDLYQRISERAIATLTSRSRK